LEVKLPAERLAVRCDVVRLAQVLLNLLNNSAKYTPEGGRITLTVERTSTNQARISVADTGMGIAPNMLPKIFDLFTQLDRTLDRAEGGLGIGLTLVRRLTELHDGSVEVSSPGIGQGSEFVVNVPLIDESELSETRKPASDKHYARIPGRRILVVDDNRDSADSLAMLLRLFGNDVRTVYDGRQALALMDGYRPALVFLDIGLPGMNGLAVAKSIRANEAFRDTVLVALTGYGTEEDRLSCEQAGFNVHFVKPIDLEALQALLHQTSQ
jgi:CheY-like chemotaxis protein